MTKRKRRLLIVALTLGVAAAGAVGVVFVLKRGKVSQDPLVRGIRAERRGKFERAESLYRRLLEAKPDHVQAYPRLIHVLRSQGKIEEMKVAAKTRCDQVPESNDGWETLVHVAMLQGRFAEAEQIARSRAAHDPLLLQWALWRIQDLSDDPRRRLAAADAALRYAQLAYLPEARAQAELFAARTLSEIAEIVTEEAATQLRARAQKLVSDSEARLKRSIQLKPTRAGDTLLARVQLLTESQVARAAAAEKLRLFLAAHADDIQAGDVRRELIDYRLHASSQLSPRAESADPNESREAYIAAAAELAKPLANLPAFQLLRVLRAFEQSGNHAEALRLLELRDNAGKDALIEVYRLRLRLATSPESKDETAQQALELIGAAPDWRIATAAYDVARAAGKPEPALDALMAYQKAHPNQRLALGIASLMASSEGKAGAVPELIEQGISDEGRTALLGPILQILDRAGSEHVFAYFEKRIQEGAEDELRLRLERTLYSLRMIGRLGEDAAKTKEKEELLASARRDLERCAEIEIGGTPELWLVAARTALPLTSTKVAGTCVARMIRSMDGQLVRVLSIFRGAAIAEDEAVRREFLDALAAGVEGSDDQQWVAALGEAVARGESDPAKLLDALVEKVSIEKANARTLEFIAPLAAGLRRADLAEQASRRLIDADPAHMVGTLVLGSVLVDAGKFAEVLKLHEATGRKPEELPGAAHRQCVGSLIQLDRIDEAEARARRYFDANPRVQDAYTVLAQALISADKKREALGVLMSAEQTAAVRMQRAQLLVELEEPELAEEVLWGLVRRAPNLIRAWSMLAQIYAGRERSEELIEPLTAAIETMKRNRNDAGYSALLVLRGMVREKAGQDSAATDDYIKGIELGNRGFLALNNAAWLLSRADEPKLENARRYIEMALEVAPEHPSVNDTAAHIYRALKEFDRALEAIDLSLAKAPKNLDYRLTRAGILADKGDRPAAIAEIDRVLAAGPSPAVERKASALREKLQGDPAD